MPARPYAGLDLMAFAWAPPRRSCRIICLAAAHAPSPPVSPFANVLHQRMWDPRHRHEGAAGLGVHQGRALRTCERRRCLRDAGGPEMRPVAGLLRGGHLHGSPCHAASDPMLSDARRSLFRSAFPGCVGCLSTFSASCPARRCRQSRTRGRALGRERCGVRCAHGGAWPALRAVGGAGFRVGISRDPECERERAIQLYRSDHARFDGIEQPAHRLHGRSAFGLVGRLLGLESRQWLLGRQHPAGHARAIHGAIGGGEHASALGPESRSRPCRLLALSRNVAGIRAERREPPRGTTGHGLHRYRRLALYLQAHRDRHPRQ